MLQTKGALLGVGRMAEVYAWGDDQVLKLSVAGTAPDAVHHEAQIGRLVFAAGLSAPATGAVLEVEGRLGILYERIDGPSLLHALGEQPERLPHWAVQFATLHAQMHRSRCPGLPSQRADLVRAIEAALQLSATQKQRLLDRLAGLPAGDAICHGDYHPDNVLVTPRGLVVIDWVTASAGNPVADLARTTLLFRVAQAPSSYPAAYRQALEQARRGFLAAYLHAYRDANPFSDADLDAWLPILAAARLCEGLSGEEEERLLELACNV